MQLWNLQTNEKTRAKRKLKGSTPEGSDPKDSPTTTTTTTTYSNKKVPPQEAQKNLETARRLKKSMKYCSYTCCEEKRSAEKGNCQLKVNLIKNQTFLIFTFNIRFT